MVTDVSAIKGRLGEISELQKLIIGTLLKQNASLPVREFQSNLKTIAKAFESATTHEVPIDTGTMDQIQAKLSATKNHDSDYWKTASSLINYRFAVPSQVSQSTLPNCFDNFLEYRELTPHVPGKKWVHEQTFGNCELNIDDLNGYLQSPFGKSLREHGDPSGVILRFHLHDGIVHYHGGELIPFQLLECLRCEFHVNAKQSPPSVVGQKIIQTLIADNTKKVELSGSQAGQ
jgi:hypothetical protein